MRWWLWSRLERMIGHLNGAGPGLQAGPGHGFLDQEGLVGPGLVGPGLGLLHIAVLALLSWEQTQGDG